MEREAVTDLFCYLVPPDVRANYVKIIDGILAASDLTTISEKRVRRGIQEAVQYDVTPQKAAIRELIMERWDFFNARQNGEVNGDTSTAAAQSGSSQQPLKAEASSTNGHAPTPTPASPSKTPSVKRAASSDPSAISDVVDTPPPKKKRKSGAVDTDAALAAKLQAEENARSRPTRGGQVRKPAPKKKTPKKVKKNADGSDESASEVEKPKRTGGFHKPLTLSPALSSLLGGETTLSRPETVSRIWKHIKANDLQDPADKRQIICDDGMRAVFKTDKVHMFTMTKILNQNLYGPDE
ncbi:MAG: hypothetical protein Q9227_007972 [Pyrenula ochraceoflavens]